MLAAALAGQLGIDRVVPGRCSRIDIHLFAQRAAGTDQTLINSSESSCRRDTRAPSRQDDVEDFSVELVAGVAIRRGVLDAITELGRPAANEDNDEPVRSASR